MNKWLLMFVGLLSASSYSVAALPVQQPMSAAQAASLIAFATFPNGDCVLSSDLNVSNPNQKIVFSLHTASQDISVTLNSSDMLIFTYDQETGAESLSGQGIEMTVANWKTITQIGIDGTECSAL